VTGRAAVDAGGAAVFDGAVAVAFDAYRDCVLGCESRKRHDVHIESEVWGAGMVRYTFWWLGKTGSHTRLGGQSPR